MRIYTEIEYFEQEDGLEKAVYLIDGFPASYEAYNSVYKNKEVFLEEIISLIKRDYLFLEVREGQIELPFSIWLDDRDRIMRELDLPIYKYEWDPLPDGFYSYSQLVEYLEKI